MITLLSTEVVHAQANSGSYMYNRLNQLDIGWVLGGYILVIFMAGAFGGFISFLMNFKVTEEELCKPIEQSLIRREQELAKQNKRLSEQDRKEAERQAKKQKWKAIFKCCLSQAVIGGGAAPPVLLLLKPDNAFALIAMSLVVGSAGSAFFRALQERMLEYVRREERVTRQAQIQIKQQSDRIGELIGALSENDIEKAKEIAEELKGLCAAGTATFGKPASDISATSESQTKPIQGSNSMSADDRSSLSVTLDTPT
ncbi:MAG TPA: hypothetical protein V6C91_11090 [Coleofasciculaceae cyanobacterium]